jgi:hypothetical protein
LFTSRPSSPRGYGTVIWEARQAIIRKLKAEGKVKVSLLSRAEITRLAEAHLREHAAELLAKTSEGRTRAKARGVRFGRKLG